MSYTPLQIAESFIQTGELEDARAALDDHLAQHPDDDDARRLRAAVARRLDDTGTLVRDVMQLSVRTAADWHLLSTALEKHGEPLGALAAGLAAHRAEPNDARLIARLADLYSAAGHYDDALALIRQQPPDWRWLQREGDILAQSGDDAQATARYGLVLSQLAARFTLDADAHITAIYTRVLLARARAYHRMALYAQAAKHYDAAAQYMPDDPIIPFNQGLLHALTGDLARALSLCRPALKKAPASLRDEMLADLNDPALSDLRVGLLNEDA